MNEKRSGLTLVELTVSIAVIGMIGTVVAALMMTALGAYRTGMAQVELCREAVYAMNRMVRYTTSCQFLFVPNGSRSDTDLLAVSAGIDTDGDGRIDEDPGGDLTGDAQPGVAGVDDDGDGAVDESGPLEDDDEAEPKDEDPIDGLDNDGDGTIDEDPGKDSNGDGKAGIAGYDDDNDGQVDEGGSDDDDEDGQNNEDPAEPIIFYLDGDVLMENHPVSGVNALAHSVEQFRVQYALGENGEPRLNIILALSRGPGCEVVLNRLVHMENILQKQGMTVGGWPYLGVQYALTVKSTGNGWVNNIPPPPYYAGDSVILEAVPGPKGWTFAGWSGDVPAGNENDNPLTLLMDMDRTVWATFTK